MTIRIECSRDNWEGSAVVFVRRKLPEAVLRCSLAFVWNKPQGLVCDYNGYLVLLLSDRCKQHSDVVHNKPGNSYHYAILLCDFVCSWNQTNKQTNMWNASSITFPQTPFTSNYYSKYIWQSKNLNVNLHSCMLAFPSSFKLSSSVNTAVGDLIVLDAISKRSVHASPGRFHCSAVSIPNFPKCRPFIPLQLVF